jgi:hypothetical protein
MKTSLFYLALVAFICWIPFNSHAATENNYVKNYAQQYNVNPNVQLSTETSFGEVIIESWDNNEISIDVEVSVEAKSESEAQKVFERIELKMYGSKERVSIKTEMSGNNNNNQFEINIRIKAPENAVLFLAHAFGNLKIGTFRNKAEIDASYGELEIEDLSNKELEIEMSFGEAIIHNVGGGLFQVEFGAMKINHLHYNSEIKSSYGSVEVNIEGTNCHDLDIDNEFCEIDIEIPENMSYRVEGKASFGDIELPKNTNNEKIEKDFASFSIEATIGQNPEGELLIDSSFGDVTVDYR